MLELLWELYVIASFGDRSLSSQVQVFRSSLLTLLPSLLHSMIVTLSSAQGHESHSGMRAIFLTLHFRGHGTVHKINSIPYLHGVNVLVREEKKKVSKRNIWYLRKTKVQEGDMKCQETLQMKEDTVPWLCYLKQV